MFTAAVATTRSHSHALMVCAAWLALLFMLLHAVAAEAVFIGKNRVEHVGRVMSYGLNTRGELNNNGLTGGVRANTPDARKEDFSEVIGDLKNSGRQVHLFPPQRN